ncbi:hypothetical protein ONS95_011365 [Cadophora gregata]|uniref:uncharacterized protein n=1 Tax=Cadophora gregata TaxID=51156 RepID=UPI0026DAD2A6|nr:uncharacterized protein ONS95_011365 [Cadophora gregata]KAK0119941.1 hypothetical protein ONS95_011365 [Cadophora gregata]KAK0120975.1 hypothetical protein ONS96_011168 [Cadophora gregata f. sp. sojae]
MPFRSSKVQSRIMEADSRPSLSISFLDLPSPFHASHLNPYSPHNSPSTNLSSPPDTSNQSPRYTGIYDRPNTHGISNNLSSSTSSWWPIGNAFKHNYNKLDEANDEGLLTQSHGVEVDIIEDAMLQRTLRRRLFWELIALGGLLVFLLGIIVLCIRGTGGMRMDGRILARD